jgi:hypothetical protein
MKKDRGNLDVLMSNLLSKIVEFNNASNEANIEIDRLITNGIREAGYDENDQTRTQDISDVKRLTCQNLRNDIYCAEDVRQRAHIFDASMGAEGLSDTTHSTIISLIRNEHIIEQIASVSDIENEIIQTLGPIREQSKPISQAIIDEHFGTRVDCCPTYWTLLKRFV